MPNRGYIPLLGRQSLLPWALVLCIAAIQTAVECAGGFRDPLIWKWYVLFGLSGDGVFHHGRVWQLVTHVWLHGGMTHMLLNGLFLGLVGSRVDRMLGWRAFVRVGVAGVMGGAAGHLAATPWSEDMAPLVGASGACMALLLFLTTLSPESRMWPLPVSARNLGLGVLVSAAILVVIAPAHGVPGFSAAGRWLEAHGMGSWFQIGHACHLGGGLVGWLSARWLLRPRWNLEKLQRERARLEERARRREDDVSVR